HLSWRHVAARITAGARERSSPGTPLRRGATSVLGAEKGIVSRDNNASYAQGKGGETPCRRSVCLRERFPPGAAIAITDSSNSFPEAAHALYLRSAFRVPLALGRTRPLGVAHPARPGRARRPGSRRQGADGD